MKVASKPQFKETIVGRALAHTHTKYLGNTAACLQDIQYINGGNGLQWICSVWFMHLFLFCWRLFSHFKPFHLRRSSSHLFALTFLAIAWAWIKFCWDSYCQQPSPPLPFYLIAQLQLYAECILICWTKRKLCAVKYNCLQTKRMTFARCVRWLFGEKERVKEWKVILMKTDDSNNSQKYQKQQQHLTSLTIPILHAFQME